MTSGGRMPDFIVAGAAKSGTTAMHLMLDQHPDVFMSPIKETNYFVHGFEATSHYVDHKGRRVLEGQEDRDIIDSEAKYLAVFSGARPGQLKGESSPWYLLNPAVPQRIRAFRRDMSVVFMLRNPADVAFANFVHHLRVGSESLTLGEADRLLEIARYAEASLYPSCRHLDLARYARLLTPWLETFSPDRLHFIVYEEFRANPRSELARLFGFLEIEDYTAIDVDRQVNISGMPKSVVLRELIQGSMAFKKLLGLVIPTKPRRKLRAILEAINTGPRASMEPGLRSRLDRLYSRDVRFVEDLLDRPVPSWRDLRTVETGRYEQP